jgi:hypothetical protein
MRATSTVSPTKSWSLSKLILLVFLTGALVALVHERMIYPRPSSQKFKPDSSRRQLLEFLNLDAWTKPQAVEEIPPPRISPQNLLAQQNIVPQASTPAVAGESGQARESHNLAFLDTLYSTQHAISGGNLRVGKPSDTGSSVTKVEAVEEVETPKAAAVAAEYKVKDADHLTFLDSITAHYQDPKASSAATTVETDGRDKKKKKKRKGEDLDVNEYEIMQAHPYISPRKGTDISAENQMAILLCPNQSKCMVPELQLQKRMKVYFCKHPTNHGVRFYFLAREGLLLHPNVDLVTEDAIDTADYIVYLPGSAPWHLTECAKPSYASKLIVLDEFDGHSLFGPSVTRDQYVELYGGAAKPWYNLYFKRSFVRRRDGVFQGYPHLVQRSIYPMVYAVAEAYIPHVFNHHREIDILCTLRGSKHMSTRLRAQEWVAEYGKARGVKNYVSGQINTATRTTVSVQYFQQMFNSQIIVTVNPANWEGDFRLWEAMCTGALIFVDPVFVPHPYPLVDGVHVVYFSNTNKTDLFMKLDYYRSHPVQARKIALNGYLHAMKYHRTVNLIDYVLRTAHVEEVISKKPRVESMPNYTFTGQYLNFEAGMQQEAILNCHTPGIYEPQLDPHAPVKRLAPCNQHHLFTLK